MTGRRRSIPWDEEGFLAAFARWQDLVATPPASRRANPMASYFVERYGRMRGLAHFTRWLKIGDFLARHIVRLQREGLVWATADGALEMREDLITALCRVPPRLNRLVLADVLARVRPPQSRPHPRPRSHPRSRSPRREVDR